MPEYKVCWAVDLDAPSALEAAILAARYQRDPQGISTHFTVTCEDGTPFEIALDFNQANL